MARRISYSRGRGKLRHNNRDIISANVDKERVQNNITIIKQDLGEAYQTIFGEAQAAYNAKQKRSDRKINDYFQKLFGREPTDTVLKNKNDQQSFYEFVVGVGDMHDTGFETNPEMAGIATKCMQEYLEGFQERNPKFYVFNAVIHLDEKTPHAHYDFIPFADGYKTGMSRQQGISKALEQMGYGKGENAIKNFTQSERRVFREICEHHGIEIADEEKGRGETLTTSAYREYAETREKTEKLKTENEKLSAEKDTKVKQVVSDFVSGKGAKKVAAAEKIIDNAEAVSEAICKANVEREQQVTNREKNADERERNLDIREKVQERKEQQLAVLQRTTEATAKAVEADRKALEAEKKSFVQAVAIKARQLVDKVLRSLGIRLNRGHDLDSQINLCLQQERKERQWRQR